MSTTPSSPPVPTFGAARRASFPAPTSISPRPSSIFLGSSRRTNSTAAFWPKPWRAAPPKIEPMSKTLEAHRKFPTGEWRQQLDISLVRDTVYIDKGNGSFTPRSASSSSSPSSLPLPLPLPLLHLPLRSACHTAAENTRSAAISRSITAKSSTSPAPPSPSPRKPAASRPTSTIFGSRSGWAPANRSASPSARTRGKTPPPASILASALG